MSEHQITWSSPENAMTKGYNWNNKDEDTSWNNLFHNNNDSF